MKRVNIYIETDSTAPRSTQKQYGYILECMVQGVIRTKDGFGSIEGTYHQAVLHALAEAIERINQSCEVHIYTRNAYILNMIRHQLSKWAAEDFKGEIKNKEDWQKIWLNARKHLIYNEQGVHSYTSWLVEEMERRKNV